VDAKVTTASPYSGSRWLEADFTDFCSGDDASRRQGHSPQTCQPHPWGLSLWGGSQTQQVTTTRKQTMRDGVDYIHMAHR